MSSREMEALKKALRVIKAFLIGICGIDYDIEKDFEKKVQES